MTDISAASQQKDRGMARLKEPEAFQGPARRFEGSGGRCQSRTRADPSLNTSEAIVEWVKAESKLSKRKKIPRDVRKYRGRGQAQLRLRVVSMHARFHPALCLFRALELQTGLLRRDTVTF